MKPVWTGFLLCLSLCFDLGVVNVAVLRTALAQGGNAAFMVGLGSCLGDMVYFTLATLGSAALLHWQPFRWVLWLFGTIVLLVLAWRMGREVVHPKALAIGDAPEPRSGRPIALLATGMGLALASPTAILWFAAVGGSVIASFGADGRVLLQFAAGFFLAGIMWAAVFAYGAAGLVRPLGPRVVRALAFVSALLFLYFAGVVFFDGLQQIRGTLGPAGGG